MRVSQTLLLPLQEHAVLLSERVQLSADGIEVCSSLHTAESGEELPFLLAGQEWPADGQVSVKHAPDEDRFVRDGKPHSAKPVYDQEKDTQTKACPAH